MAWHKNWYRKRYKTQKDLIAAIRKITNNTPFNVPLKGNDLELISWVLSHHTAWKEKEGVGIKSIVIRENIVKSKSIGIWLIRIDDTEDNISWKHCINPKTQEQNVSKAARYEISTQMEAVPITGNCGICCTPLEGNIHIDHVILFETLLTDFLKEENISRENVVIDEVDKFNLCFSDRELAKQWYTYHKNNAQLRPVHAKCNLTRSKK